MKKLFTPIAIILIVFLVGYFVYHEYIYEYIVAEDNTPKSDKQTDR